jgi:hypothetical protein
MALKTGSSEAVQGSFPLLFIALFFSSAFFPRETMTGAYRVIANLNPISYLVEGIRGLVVDGFTAGNAAKAILVPIAIGVFSIALAASHAVLAVGCPMTAITSSALGADGGTVLRSSRGLALRGMRSIRRLPSAFVPHSPCRDPDHRLQRHVLRHHQDPWIPHDRSVNWYLPLACCMGSGFAGVGLGFSTVRDIESGFFDRCAWPRHRVRRSSSARCSRRGSES